MIFDFNIDNHHLKIAFWAKMNSTVSVTAQDSFSAPMAGASLVSGSATSFVIVKVTAATSRRTVQRRTAPEVISLPAPVDSASRQVGSATERLTVSQTVRMRWAVSPSVRSTVMKISSAAQTSTVFAVSEFVFSGFNLVYVFLFSTSVLQVRRGQGR